MSTQTTHTPQTDTPGPIMLDGTTYSAWIDGKLHTSPSREWLAEKLGLADSQAKRAADEKAARTAETDARKAAAADRLPDLADALTTATAARDEAWTAFADAATHGGPILDTFARWRIAHRKADAAKQTHARADYEARHGHEPSHGGGTPPMDLTTALDQLAAEREAELSKPEQ
jgi:hypothetical protein